MSPKLVLWLVGIVFSVVGIPLFFYGLIQIIRGIRLKQAGIRTEGEVVSVHSRDLRHEGTTTTYYFPTIRYTNNRGETVEFRATAYEIPPLLGQKIPVIYHPKRKGIQMDDVKGYFNLPTALLIMGLIFIVGAYFIIFDLALR